MNPTRDCATLIKHYESLMLVAYPDPGTGGDPWTIGWGHTGPAVAKHAVWSISQANEALARDIATKAADVNRLLVDIEVQHYQFDALVSFAFNVGAGALARSTLLRKLLASDDVGAADEFLRWNRAGGRVMHGLTRRRTAERAMFRGYSVACAISAGERAPRI